MTDKVKDYHDFTTRLTPQAERRRLNVGDIWVNAARCVSCGDVVRSRNRHDFRQCQCGKLAVDGGSWYAKRVYKGDYIELSDMFDDVDDDEEMEGI